MNKRSAAIFIAMLTVISSIIFVTGCSSEKEIVISKIVRVTGGEIEGAYTDESQEILAYKGIPYAAPPIGENRWRRPQPVEEWMGVKQCTEFGNSAWQGEQNADATFTDEFIVSDKNYSEDCLTLNVWTKNQTTKGARPVVVYIHGGAWVAGGSSCPVYSGENISKRDIVFVSVNYRLGVFGWFGCKELAEEDEEGSTGNYGIMDLVKSLEWVRDNIQVFGGDKNNVTIMGQSAGADLVNALMVSPKADGLFKNAFCSSFNSIGSGYAGTRKNTRLSSGLTLQSLRSLTADEVVQTLGSLYLGECNDGVYLDMDYAKAIEEGRSKNVNLIIGYVNSEESEKRGLLGDNLFAPVIEGLTFGESLMGVANCVAKARANSGAEGRTYIYRFDHEMSGPNKQIIGAFHTSDIPYFLYNLLDYRKNYWEETDYKTADAASEYLVNFLKTGNPNSKNSSLPMWIESKGDYNYIVLNSSPQTRKFSADKIDSLWFGLADLGYKQAWF